MSPNLSPEHVDLLIELQVLDNLPRTGYLLRGVRHPESVSEHSWHVVFLVWLVGKGVDRLDLGHAIELAIVHDMAEVRVGDLPSTASQYLPKQIKHQSEMAALRSLSSMDERAAILLEEYQQGTSLESRFVKACDKLQLMIKVMAYERWHWGDLADFWADESNFFDGGFEAIRKIYDELRRRRHG